MSNLSWEAFYLTDYAGLDDAAGVWDRYISEASDFETTLIDGIPVLKEGAPDQARDDFDGETADLVRGQARHIAEGLLDDLDAYAGRIKALLQEAKTDFETKRDGLADLFAEKSVYLSAEGGPGEERFEVNESDLYNYLTGSGAVEPMNEYEANDYERRVREQAVDLSDRFKTLMDSVRELDDRYAADFKALNDDPPPLPPYVGSGFEAKTAEYLQELHQDFLDKIESGEATPEEVNDWWNSLPEGDQELFVHELPELVGPVDGIPTEDRDDANRILLEQEITGLDEQISELEAQAEEAQGKLDADPSWSTIRSEIEVLRDRQEGLTNLQDQIDGGYSIEGGPDLPYYLIGLDSSGDGQAVVSVGNPDTAHNVNVYVPGTGADLGGLAGDLGRAETMAADAYEISPDSTTASMVWLGYDAPDTVGDASSQSYAEGAAGDLSAFVDGLRATAEGDGPANLTMTGHSYGTTTIGVAARDEGLDVDNMIFVGSPGVGVDSAEELGIGADNVWASRNAEDIISWARTDAYIGGEYDAMIHGTDPTSYDFGGNEFFSEATREGTTADHSAYWDEENDEGRTSMAKIVTGNTEGM